MKTVVNEEFMNLVVEELVKNFLTALQNVNGEKNYYSHVGCLAEILDWAKDFCEYYDKLVNGKFYNDVQRGFRNDKILHSLIKSFGRQRLLTFYKQTTYPGKFFNEKYLSLKIELDKG
jgi:hypothetical protein